MLNAGLLVDGVAVVTRVAVTLLLRDGFAALLWYLVTLSARLVREHLMTINSA